MSVEIKAIKGASWLAIFKLCSQIISWTATVIVARILVPGDYGLMTMATIITGYAFIFNELGLGQAIIQSPHVTEKQLSSLFYFSFLLSLFLCTICHRHRVPNRSHIQRAPGYPVDASNIDPIYFFWLTDCSSIVAYEENEVSLYRIYRYDRSFGFMPMYGYHRQTRWWCVDAYRRTHYQEFYETDSPLRHYSMETVVFFSFRGN